MQGLAEFMLTYSFFFRYFCKHNILSFLKGACILNL